MAWARAQNVHGEEGAGLGVAVLPLGGSHCDGPHEASQKEIPLQTNEDLRS